jgi:hypothetical protein
VSATKRFIKCVASGLAGGVRRIGDAQAGCDYSRAFPMHTQVKFTGFHGNWWDDEANSQTVTMYC